MKNGGRIPWSATAISETFKTSFPVGKHPMKSRSEYHLMARLCHLVQWSNITLYLQKDPWRLHQFGKKVVLPGTFRGSWLHAVEIWKRDIFLVADIEELEKMDISEIFARRLNAKEVLMPMNGEKIIPSFSK